METFIKAVEIWAPCSHAKTLELSSSYYGDVAPFAEASAGLTFDFDVGLPGKTWSARRPIVLTDLRNTIFKRTEAAAAAGITCGISMPVFCGEFLMAVMVLFCGDTTKSQGAVEIWHNDDDSDNELRLTSGYYGNLEQFEWISRHLTIMRGRGLPGGAWALKAPLIMDDLANSNTFLRATHAAIAGITTGLSIPFFESEQRVDILTFLAAGGTPLANRFEIWVPSQDHMTLSLSDGHSFDNQEHIDALREKRIHRGDGARGDCWLTGRPSISPDPENANATMITLPVISEAKLSALVCISL